MNVPKRIMNGTRRDYTLETLFRGIDMGTADTNVGERQLLSLTLPAWQRPEQWSVEKKKAFMEGIFLGFGTGQFVVNGSDWQPGEYGIEHKPFSGWLIDGQQRISAVRDFVFNGMVLFEGLTYKGMTAPEVRRFHREQFPCFELDYTADEQLLKTLYNRLNFGGVAHTPEQRVY